MQSVTTDNSIPDAALDRLIAAHDGDVALLFLYLRRSPSADTEQAARDLCRTLGQMDEAEEKLRRMGLVPVTPADGRSRAAAPAEELPEYSAEDLIRRSREDSGFAAIVQEAQKVLGHILSSSDMKRLFGIYDYLALPPEVILELLNHCVSAQPGRRPSMRYIEKEAYVWVNREIVTLEQAEEYIRSSKRRRDETGRVGELLGIRGRELSATEAKYIASWLDMGFDDEALSVAYDRTLTNTGSLRWSYMNKILSSWYDKGIRTAADIGEKEPRRAAPASAKAEDKPIDIDRLRDILDRM